MRERLKRAWSRAQYAAIGGAIGAFVGGLFSRKTASTGAATGALVGAILGEKRHSAAGVIEQMKDRGSEEEEQGGFKERLSGMKAK